MAKRAVLAISPGSNKSESDALQSTVAGFNPTHIDVFIVRHLLQSLRLPRSQNFPPELALIVLSFANYHPRLSSYHRKRMVYKANKFWELGPNANVARLYLTSPPIPILDGKAGIKAIKSQWITFQMRSKDQGWATFGGHGTYHNSHTWFEASILRPMNDQATVDSLVTLDTFRTPSDPRQTLNEYGWDFVEHNQNVTWKVHNNITAIHTYTDYRVDWVAGVKTDVEDPRALGDGEGFLEKLMAGCVVALWARAEHQAWENKVKEATIEIGYEVI